MYSENARYCRRVVELDDRENFYQRNATIELCASMGKLEDGANLPYNNYILTYKAKREYL